MVDNHLNLCVTPRISLTRTRQLPIDGKILVSKGDRVDMDTVVAEAEIKGDFRSINAAAALGILPSQINAPLSVSMGDMVTEGQLLGETRALLGLIHNRLVAPASGVIDDISTITGQLVIAKPPVPVSLTAHLAGTVTQTDRRTQVTISSDASLLQGIFGIGKETYGTLYCIDEDSTSFPKEDGIILMIPGSLTEPLLDRAIEQKVLGIVAASASGRLLMGLTGEHLNPAATGNEAFGLTIVLTEGFGTLTMAAPSRRLLQALNGRKIAMSGATQVRAGVIRPEILGPPLDEDWGTQPSKTSTVGTTVRIVRGEAFGAYGTITAVPHHPKRIPSGGKSLVYEITTEDGKTRMVPRANVEWIASV